jgi:hypothetical protein
VEGESPPRRWLAGPAAVLEWTGRMLRDRHGYWVAESVSVASASGQPRARDRASAAALVLTGAFRGTERLRVGFDLLERAASGFSGRAR